MENDYEIGYKKPPKHTQFQKGQSGNPNGRPRKETPARTLRQIRDEFFEVAEREVTVIENGRPLKMTASQAILYRLMQKALSGDRLSIKQCMDSRRSITDENEMWQVQFMEMILQSEKYLDEQYAQRVKHDRN